MTAEAHDLWVVQQGKGPDVLLIGGLGDSVEAWQFRCRACATASG